MSSHSNHKPMICSDYLSKLLNAKQVKNFIKLAKINLKPYDFTTFAFRGVSGALITPPLALAMKKSLIVVRKPKHDASETHSCMPVEGDLYTKNYIIVDDFMSSGTTVKAIIEGISSFAPNARCIGVCMFNAEGRLKSSVDLEFIRDNAFLRNFCEDAEGHILKSKSDEAITDI